VRRVNERLCGDRTEQFVTLFYAVLDLGTCTLTYANAGHPGPVLLSPGAGPAVLSGGGLPAGVTAEAEYRAAEARLRPGDRLWAYSDGLPEAMDLGGEAFGQARLTSTFRAADGVPLGDAVRQVVGAVEGWAGPGGPQDDVSVVALEVGRAGDEGLPSGSRGDARG
jgi:sigma-B regulation protein RsbU (phosphoserine phosphatase)